VYNGFLRSGEWKQFDPANPAMDYPKIATTPTWSNGNAGVLKMDGLWVAIRFDASSMGAHIVGVVGPGSGGSAVAGSCWTSFVNGVA
jgi:hypothetical protein